MKKIILILFIILSPAIFAEYRVYQYYVKSKYNYQIEGNKPYLVTSTLDPVSYVAYNGGNDSIEVSLLRSWECKGYTGEFKDVCSAPADLAEKK
jgi:hypothetical protein